MFYNCNPKQDPNGSKVGFICSHRRCWYFFVWKYQMEIHFTLTKMTLFWSFSISKHYFHEFGHPQSYGVLGSGTFQGTRISHWRTEKHLQKVTWQGIYYFLGWYHLHNLHKSTFLDLFKGDMLMVYQIIWCESSWNSFSQELSANL